MKIKHAILLTLCLGILFIFVGCNKYTNSNIIDEFPETSVGLTIIDTESDIILDTEITTSMANLDNNLLPGPSIETPPEKQTYFFDDYSDLINWLRDESFSLRNEFSQNQNYIDYLKEINDATAKQTPLYIPYFEESPAELRVQEGYSGITFMISELYNIPWIWYYVKIGNEIIIIKCACLSQKDFSRVDTERASIAVKNFSHSAPNIDNYESKSGYKSIVEKTISFSQKSISALYLELTNDSRISLQFVYDKTMVIITGSPAIINSEYMNSISLQKANLQ